MNYIEIALLCGAVNLVVIVALLTGFHYYDKHKRKKNQ